MSPHRTLATAGRVLRQLRHDHRTVALLLVIPCVLMGIVAWMYQGTGMFAQVGPDLLGMFPMVVMFVVTSVATLRERQSGTLERLLTTPLRKAEFMLGYAIAFGVMAVLQSLLAAGFAAIVCGLSVAAGLEWLIGVGVLAALLGTALGLLASGFAATEFQAVQFMPAFIFPQFLLCGLFVPRDRLPTALAYLSDAMPLSYVVDATHAVARQAQPWSQASGPVGVVAGCILVALALGAATLRRRTA